MTISGSLRQRLRLYWVVALLVCLAGAVLSGCISTFAQLNSEILTYKGKKIDALIDRIGYPDSQIVSAGGVVYTWTPTNSTQTDLAPLQGPPAGAPHAPMLATITAPDAANLRLRCPLQVQTDRAGTILQLSWQGQGDGCAP
jgi:hypothetical protein